MALIPENRYPGKTTPATGDYPYGSAKNVAVPGDGTGTPWEKDIVNDTLGFLQALLVEAGIVPDGDVDTVTDSQYLSSLLALLGLRVLKSGDTMTGDLEIVKAIDELTGYKAVNSIGGLSLEVVSGSGAVRITQTDSAGVVEKGIMSALRNAETILNYNGVKKIETAAMGAAITGQAWVSDAAPTAPEHLARKDYVDGTTSKTTNGYMILPSGIIVQWGTSSITAPSNSVVLPIAFPNAFFGAVVTPTTDSTKTFGATKSGLTNLVIYLSSGTRDCYWIAVGH